MSRLSDTGDIILPYHIVTEELDVVLTYRFTAKGQNLVLAYYFVTGDRRSNQGAIHVVLQNVVIRAGHTIDHVIAAYREGSSLPIAGSSLPIAASRHTAAPRSSLWRPINSIKFGYWFKVPAAPWFIYFILQLFLNSILTSAVFKGKFKNCQISTKPLINRFFMGLAAADLDNAWQVDKHRPQQG